MCFYLRGAVERTATKDIVVWKKIDKNNRSGVYAFQYTPNTLYRLKKKLKIKWGNTIDHGFHSYNQHPGTKRYLNKFVKMIIPKGAKYYENSNERVSTSIRTLDLRHIPYTSKEAKL